MTNYPPHPEIARKIDVDGATNCVCPRAIDAMLCRFGHMLECHYPLTCEQANCSHVQRRIAVEAGTNVPD